MIIIIILVYILNVFFNRWLNKIMYKKYDKEPIPAIWFLSFIGTIICFIAFYKELEIKDNWFTGKYW